MAQHISIKHYLNEDWLFNLIDQCKTIAWQYREIENSTTYFKQISENYKCNIDKPLTKEDDNLFISDCNIEIHLDKSKLVDIFIVA
jgi:hypothetical protein